MRRWLLIAAIAGTFAGGVAQVPLSWAAGDRLALADPDAAALGTVWDGTVAHIDGLPPIATRLRGTTLGLRSDAPALQLAATATPQAIRDVSLTLPIASLARFDTRLEGLTGQLRLVADEIVIADGACVSASGTAFTDVLAVNPSSLRWTGPELSGPIACVEGDVGVTLSGREGTAQVDAAVRISPLGPYRTDITMSGIDPTIASFLPLFGFQPAGTNAVSLRESGSWQ